MCWLRVSGLENFQLVGKIAQERPNAKSVDQLHCTHIGGKLDFRQSLWNDLEADRPSTELNSLVEIFGKEVTSVGTGNPHSPQYYPGELHSILSASRPVLPARSTNHTDKTRIVVQRTSASHELL
jgi:hypothetical protein